jgi:hypothetical protein
MPGQCLKNIPRPLPPKSFAIYLSLSTLSFDAIKSEALKSVVKQTTNKYKNTFCKSDISKLLFITAGTVRHELYTVFIDQVLGLQ